MVSENLVIEEEDADGAGWSEAREANVSEFEGLQHFRPVADAVEGLQGQEQAWKVQNAGVLRVFGTARPEEDHGPPPGCLPEGMSWTKVGHADQTLEARVPHSSACLEAVST